MIASLKGKVWDGRVANESVVDEGIESYIAEGERDNGGIWKEHSPVDIVAVIVGDWADMEIGNVESLQRIKSCIRRLADETSGTELFGKGKEFLHSPEIA